MTATYKKINPEQTASEYGAEVVKLQGDEILGLGRSHSTGVDPREQGHGK